MRFDAFGCWNPKSADFVVSDHLIWFAAVPFPVVYSFCIVTRIGQFIIMFLFILECRIHWLDNTESPLIFPHSHSVDSSFDSVIFRSPGFSFATQTKDKVPSLKSLSLIHVHFPISSQFPALYYLLDTNIYSGLKSKSGIVDKKNLVVGLEKDPQSVVDWDKN